MACRVWTRSRAALTESDRRVNNVHDLTCKRGTCLPPSDRSSGHGPLQGRLIQWLAIADWLYARCAAANMPPLVILTLGISFIYTPVTSWQLHNHLQQAYFSHKTEFRCEPYIYQAKTKHLRRTIAMFRVGNHWLQVCRGRYAGLEYRHRTCPTCVSVVEDERHAVFDCRDYDVQRAKFADLFVGTRGHNLRSFLVHNPCHRLALFLTECKSARSEGGSQSLRPRWPDTSIGRMHRIRPSQIDFYDSDPE